MSKTGENRSSTEERAAKRAKKNKLRDLLLLSAYVGVGMGMMVMAPNSMRLLKYVRKVLGPTPRLKERISQKYSELIAKGLFERRRTADGVEIVLTEKGKEFGEELALKEQFLTQKPRKWDFKWRVIMFDIWERRRSVRDKLRIALSEFGFAKLQDSVWVYPHPSEDVLIFLRKSLKLGPSILYMVVDEIEHDEHLRNHFKLPLD